MLNLGVLVSGGGTNLQAIIDAVEQGCLERCRIAIVVSSRKDAYALERAEKHGLPAICLPRKGKTVKEYDRLLVDHLKKHNIDLVVLAGFMCILGPLFNREFRHRAMNVHPSLIPSFCGRGFYGTTPHEKALEYGVKITGATVHFVELETDSGPIILQKPVEVRDDDTVETLQKRVMREAEWKILPEAVKLFSEGRLVVEGRRVRIIKRKDDIN